jgi:regulator of PEP synthase PpsR (kinase-PPPase family)
VAIVESALAMFTGVEKNNTIVRKPAAKTGVNTRETSFLNFVICYIQIKQVLILFYLARICKKETSQQNSILKMIVNSLEEENDTKHLIKIGKKHNFSILIFTVNYFFISALKVEEETIKLDFNPLTESS